MTNTRKRILVVRVDDLYIKEWKQEGLRRVRCVRCHERCWLSPGGFVVLQKESCEALCLQCAGARPDDIVTGWRGAPPALLKEWDDLIFGR